MSFRDVSLARVGEERLEVAIVEGDGVEVAGGGLGRDFDREVVGGEVAVVLEKELGEAAPCRRLDVLVPVEDAGNDGVVGVVEGGGAKNLEELTGDFEAGDGVVGGVAEAEVDGACAVRGLDHREGLIEIGGLREYIAINEHPRLAHEVDDVLGRRIPHLLAQTQSCRRNTSERANKHRPAKVGNLVLVDSIGAVEVVDGDLGEVLDGVVDAEVERAEMSDTVDRVGGSGGENDGAGGADEFGEEVESPDGEHVLTRGVGHTLEFVDPVLGCETLGEVKSQVQERGGAVSDDVVGDGLGEPRKRLFDLVDEVVVEERKNRGDLVLHQLSLGVSHLVWSAIDVEDGEVVRAEAGGVALAVGNGAHEGGLVVVDGERVGACSSVAFRWNGEVVGKDAGRRDDEEKCREDGDESGEEDLHVFYFLKERQSERECVV